MHHITQVMNTTSTHSMILSFAVVTIGFEEDSYAVSEGGILELVVVKSIPCDFKFHFQVHTYGLLYEERIFEAANSSAVVSVTFPDDDVSLEPDEMYILTLSLSVPDPQTELGVNLSNLTIIDDDSEWMWLF